MPPKKRGRPPKPKPLTQKEEKEMMGQEDIASTAIELTEAQKRMAKAREAKKTKASSQSKENITLKITEPKTRGITTDAPFGYTATGRIRKKPTKKHQANIDKIRTKIAYKEQMEQKAKASVKAKKVKAKKVYPPPSVNATAREQIGMIEEDLDAREREKDARQRKKDNPTDLPIKKARRLIQLLYKGKEVLIELTHQNPSWTQDGYYTTAGDMNYTEIQDELERLFSNYKDTFVEAVEWFKDAYDDKRWDKPDEKLQKDRKLFTYEYFGLEENDDYKTPDDDDYDEDWEEFNGEWILDDWNDFERGLDATDTSLKNIIVELEKGGFMSNISFSPSSSEASSEASTPASSRSSSASSVGTARWDEASTPASSRSSSGYGLYGGALSSKDLKGLLNASYQGNTNVGDFILDKGLSTSTSKVYHNPKNNQTVVAHRGTEGLVDWGNNLVYAVGGKSAYKMTPRYKEAEAVQKRAESKYGKANVSTIGHSQGGLQSELLGGESKEIITLNKATRPFEKNQNQNQTDVRSSRDIVSALNPFGSKSSKDIEIQGETYNPLTEHTADILNRLDENQMIGEGIRKMVGGATTDQRSLANLLRHRLDRFGVEPPKLSNRNLGTAKTNTADVFLTNYLRGKPYDLKELQYLLNNITHSADPDHSLLKNKRTGAVLNPYVDYEERPNHISNANFTAIGNPSNITPLPNDLLEASKDAYFALMEHLDTTGRQGRPKELLYQTEKETLPTALDKEYRNYLDKEATKKGVAKVALNPKLYGVKNQEKAKKQFWKKAIGSVRDTLAEKKRIAEEEADAKRIAQEDADAEEMKAKAFWTNPEDLRVKKWIGYANDMKSAWSRGDGETYTKLRTNLMNTSSINNALARWFAEADEKLGEGGGDAIANELEPVSLLKVSKKEDKFEITSSHFVQKAKGGKHYITGVDISGRIELPMGAGKGLPTGKIDFEDINWGSLTEQMKAYNSQHSKDMDLEGFAKMIIADPSKFQKKTLQRARFYLNVLLPKKKK